MEVMKTLGQNLNKTKSELRCLCWRVDAECQGYVQGQFQIGCLVLRRLQMMDKRKIIRGTKAIDMVCCGGHSDDGGDIVTSGE